MSLSITSRFSCDTHGKSIRTPRGSASDANRQQREKEGETRIASLTTFLLASNLSLSSDACTGEEHGVRSARGRGDRGRVGERGAHVLVEEVAVDGPVEGVLERAAVEQPHPLLLPRPPRQVPRRRRHRPRRRTRSCFFSEVSLSTPLRCWIRIGSGGGRDPIGKPKLLGGWSDEAG